MKMQPNNVDNIRFFFHRWSTGEMYGAFQVQSSNNLFCFEIYANRGKRKVPLKNVGYSRIEG